MSRRGQYSCSGVRRLIMMMLNIMGSKTPPFTIQSRVSRRLHRFHQTQKHQTRIMSTSTTSAPLHTSKENDKYLKLLVKKFLFEKLTLYIFW